MPIYEYECGDCRHAFDCLQKIDAPRPPCPECGAVKVHKKISSSSFSLKGEGWEADGYGLRSKKGV